MDTIPAAQLRIHEIGGYFLRQYLLETPLGWIALDSGYFHRGLHLYPKQGSAAPFRLYMNYALDRLALRHAPVTDGSMEFSKA